MILNMEKNAFCHQKRNTDESKMHFIPENTGTVTVMIFFYCLSLSMSMYFKLQQDFSALNDKVIDAIHYLMWRH